MLLNTKINIFNILIYKEIIHCHFKMKDRSSIWLTYPVTADKIINQSTFETLLQYSLFYILS
jgi:hypothetical protein